jgi:type IV pilus assembly protein PilA
VLTWLHKRLRREEGFTLIELLVVILIIGILAAIAIPAFLSQKGKGEDAGAKSAAREVQTAMETYYTDNQTYVGADQAALRDIEASLSSGAGASINPSGQSATGYTLTSTSKTGNTFTIVKNTDGTVTRSCTRTNTKGGCPTSLAW